MLAIAEKYLALNSRLEPQQLPPGWAQDLQNCNLESGGLVAQLGLGSTITTGSGTPRSLYKFNSVYSISATAYQYAEWDGRAYRCASSSNTQRTADGTNWYNLSMTAPSACSAAAGAAGSPNGAYNIKVVYVSTMGDESLASSATSVTVTNQQISLTNIPVSGDAQVTSRRIYRTQAGGSVYYLDSTIANNVDTTLTLTASDGTLSANSTLSNSLQTDTTAQQFTAICFHPNGTMLGAKDNILYYARQGQPSLWISSRTFRETIKALIPFSGSTLVLTTAGPYWFTGDDGDSFRIVDIPSQDGCLERDTAVDMGLAVFWLSQNGVVAFDGRETRTIAKDSLSDSFIASISETNAKAARYNDRYILAHSGGTLEWNPRLGWLKCSVVATALHYNRTDKKLYVVESGGANVKQFEGGSALTITWRSGDLVFDMPERTKHFTDVYLYHNGTNTVKCYKDGTAVTWPDGNTYKSVTRSSKGMSRVRLPRGVMAKAVSIEIGGTGTVHSPPKVKFNPLGGSIGQ